MRRIVLVFVVVSVAVVAARSLPIGASQERGLRATLSGFDEVPAVSTVASGSFVAKVGPGDESVAWTLSYDGIAGSVTQSHIHFAMPRTNGGVAVWLCSNLASPPTPPGVPVCPSPGGTVSGVIEAADVAGPSGQGIAPGELAEFLRAVRAGATYVNVHSSAFPGGEIRGQIE